MGKGWPIPALMVAAVASALALVLPGAANAAIPSVFDGAVNCTVQGDGDRVCGSDSPRSTVETFDGVPIDVNVAFPPEPASGPDGGFPLIMIFHGYGGSKIGFGGMEEWLDQGYATFSMTDRGFHESCGNASSRAADPSGCENGFVRLIDNRYEVRDAQLFSGMLVDEGRVAPGKIGATGGSYGGGMTMALAALRDRTVMPDGSLVPWTSPDGTPMRLAAGVALITWSDLAYSLAPNGSTLDYVADSPYAGRFGVMKESLVNGLYFSGLAAPASYAPEGTPGADLTGWRNLLLAGEPYDGNPQAERILAELTGNHSSYYIDDSQPPAPLLMANGWTDDLFPVDEMVRYYNRTRTEHPKADVALFAAEIRGHPRSQNKEDVQAVLTKRRDTWMAHYIKGAGDEPTQGVEAYTQTCPGDAPSGGPYFAKDWAHLARGEVTAGLFGNFAIAPDGGDESVAAAFNPVTGGGACAQTDAIEEPGTVNVDFDPAPKGGLTLMGSVTVNADFILNTGDENSQVAARLVDVAPDGTQTLVARGLWRPATGLVDDQPFQLHPNAWVFEEGHVARLQLLPADSDGAGLGGYGRRSDGQQQVKVRDIEVRMPVRERPGAARGAVRVPLEPVLPEGYELARDFANLGDPRAELAKGALKVKGNKLVAKVRCPSRFDSCNEGSLSVKKAGKKKWTVAKGGFDLSGGETGKVKAKLTKRGKRYFAKRKGLRVKAITASAEAYGKSRQSRQARG
jgi:predicted acyl esterase